MLFKGYSEAIKCIRLRKKLTQAECAENARAATRSKIDEKTWSKYETGLMNPTANALPAIAAGLGVGETELWEESLREERAHYCGRSDLFRGNLAEEAPPIAAAIVQGLWAMKVEALPREQRHAFESKRRDLAALLTSALHMVDSLNNEFARLTAEASTQQEENDVEDDR